ncbi:Disulfide bond formation protein D [Anaerolineales bacterium]|nr:Disulfide bond formation protein D [Anaerolineales bacterium]
MTTRRKITSAIEVEDEEVLEEVMQEETVTFKKSHFYSVLVVLAFAAGILTGYVAWGRDVPAAITANQQPSGEIAEAPVTPVPQFRRYDIPTEGYPSFGPDDAEIVIVEFSDYQCPYCQRFHEETYPDLLAAYPGKIRFVYRNFPLPPSMHPDAMSAAVAALCAGDQNAYWDYHDKLFGGDALNEETYIQYATELDLNVEEFTACLSSGRHDDFIQKDMAFSTNLGVQSTPTFFVNGLAIIGAQPLSSFTQLIDKELAGEIPQ